MWQGRRCYPQNACLNLSIGILALIVWNIFDLIASILFYLCLIPKSNLKCSTWNIETFFAKFSKIISNRKHLLLEDVFWWTLRELNLPAGRQALDLSP